MKDEDYLVHNLNKIAKHLEHINWNLGKMFLLLKKDFKGVEQIEEAQKKAEEHKKQFPLNK